MMRRSNTCRSPKQMRWRQGSKARIDALAQDCAKADDGFALRSERVVDGLPVRGRYEE